MITDSFFTIGHQHMVCEDYAIHGSDYVVVADGCSNGGHSINSDWGARLLSNCVSRNLKYLHDSDFDLFKHEITRQTYIDVRQLDIPVSVLTSTLLTASVCEDKLYTTVFGDGIFGNKYKNGMYEINVVSFEGNAPYYLKYDLSLDDQWAYFDQFSGIGYTDVYIGDEKEIICEGGYEFDVRNNPYKHFARPIKDLEFSFIATDGFESFYSTYITGATKQNIAIDAIEVLRVMLDFKNFTPGFLSRQAQWNFRSGRKGSFDERGWKHADDVSMGVIYFGE